jgi:hypothetical protein
LNDFEALDYKCEVFIKITRLFEDIFREMEASIRRVGHFTVTRVTRLFEELRLF